MNLPAESPTERATLPAGGSDPVGGIGAGARLNTIVVGAGAVGRVIAYHLARGGHHVALLTRDDVTGTQARTVLYSLSRRRPWSSPIRFSAAEVANDIARLEPRDWNQVYLCVPSEALRLGLPERLASALEEATIIQLQPGLRDRSFLTAAFGQGRIVTGMVSFLSYRAPLAGEPPVESGHAFWIPPLWSSPFSGPRGRLGAVVAGLRRGGFPARQHPDVDGLVASILAVQAPLSAGLVCAGGPLVDFLRGEWFGTAWRAVSEAQTIVATTRGFASPWVLRNLTAGLVRLALRVFPRLAPFPLDAYLAAHYAKLTPQSRIHLADYIDEGLAAGLPVGALNQLLHQLPVPASIARPISPAEAG